MMTPDSIRVGYQGTHRTGARVTIYTRPRIAGDLGNYKGVLKLHELDDVLLTHVGTQNTMGQGGGFQISFKCRRTFDPLTYIDTDVWVDVSFTVDNVEWHMMRGFIDEIRFSQSSGGSGSTTFRCDITGSSFQKSYATTPLWFNTAAQENVGSGIFFQDFGASQFTGSPKDNLTWLLQKLFAIIGKAGRANYLVPTNILPIKMSALSAASVVGGNVSLDKIVNFNTDYYDETFSPRTCPTGNQLYPDTDLWTMAQAFADLQFQELWTDIYPSGGYKAYGANPDGVQGLSPGESEMTIMYRDKPFPIVAPPAGPVNKLGLASSYFTDLPLHKVNRSEISDLSLGVSSQEAFNAFMTCAALAGNSSNYAPASNFPLWSPADMERRGMRRMDASTMYSSPFRDVDNNTVLVEQQRAKLTQWYALNFEYRQGSMRFCLPKPGLRVGSRIVVSGPVDDNTSTFYIEGVRHVWDPGGWHTEIDVTRGYTGTDIQHINRLQSFLGTYTVGTGADYTAAPIKPTGALP